MWFNKPFFPRKETFQTISEAQEKSVYFPLNQKRNFACAHTFTFDSSFLIWFLFARFVRVTRVNDFIHIFKRIQLCSNSEQCAKRKKKINKEKVDKRSFFILYRTTSEISIVDVEFSTFTSYRRKKWNVERFYWTYFAYAKIQKKISWKFNKS